MTQAVKNLPAMQEMQETQVQSLGQEDPGEGHGNPLQNSCLENPHGQRSLAGYSPWGCKELDTTEQLRTQHSPGEAKSIFKTKDKFDKSGARETEGWSS